jgi:diacylglycerol kinase (ATP)
MASRDLACYESGVQRRLLVILNPRAAAGRAIRRAPRIITVLRGRGLTVDVERVDTPEAASRLACQKAPHYDVLLAAGGDGTTNAVARGMFLARTRDTALGILPLGTGNDAAELAGVGDLGLAIEALVGGRVRAVDVIEVTCTQNGQAVTQVALVYTAAGFAAEVLRRTSPAVKRWLGKRFCYSVGLLRALPRLHCPNMVVRGGGRQHEGPLLLVAACNAERAGGGVMRLAPGARPDDGQFETCLVGRLGRWAVLRYFVHLLRGTHIRLPQVHYYPATRLEVEAEPGTEVQVDGDVCGSAPARFEVRPAALRLIVAFQE